MPCYGLHWFTLFYIRDISPLLKRERERILLTFIIIYIGYIRYIYYIFSLYPLGYIYGEKLYIGCGALLYLVSILFSEVLFS